MKHPMVIKRTAVVVATLAVVFSVVVYSISSNGFAGRSVVIDGLREERLTINGQALTLWVVTSREDVAQGLGDRESMPENHGMLFDFGRPDRYTFWMRHMRFPLDIIWIRNGEIVDLVRNLPAPRHLLEVPAAHTPSALADQVLELNAGGAARYGFVIGGRIR